MKTTFTEAAKSLFKTTYPFTSNREKAACLMGIASKTGILALSCFEQMGVLSVPGLGWVHAGLGAACLLSHLAGGIHNKKLGLCKELVETIPLILLGALEGAGIQTVSQLGFRSLVYLSVTTGLYWGASPLLPSLPSLATRFIGKEEDLAEETNMLLKEFQATESV
jgi:hypothetical protein